MGLNGLDQPRQPLQPQALGQTDPAFANVVGPGQRPGSLQCIVAPPDSTGRPQTEATDEVTQCRRQFSRLGTI